MRDSSGAFGHVAAALVASLLLALPASAHPTSPELAGKFARGEYLTAAAVAEVAAGADDLAFAARALLAHCMTGSSGPDAALVDRAARDAEAALREEPGHEEAQLQLAIALSLKSRDMDAMAAWTAGYGERGKKLAEGVLKADPGNFYAHGFLAVWNIEVERIGGSMGSWMMGASLDEGRKHYEAARQLAPDDVGVHWQYARALAALDLKRYQGDVKVALDRAVAASASDHVEEVMQERAERLLAALANPDAAQKLARAML
jgi:hypothetical protein